MKRLGNLLKNFFFDEVVSPKKLQKPSMQGSPDCVIVVDASGSMYDDDWLPTRLDAAKEATVAFARRFLEEQPGACMAVVVFGCKAKVACWATTMDHCNEIHQRIGQVSTDVGGTTNMYAGLKLATTLFENRCKSRHVVLLTDGHCTGKNPGVLAETLKESSTIECVGIGGNPSDVDETLLKKIASAYPDGTKRYRWIGQKEKLIQHFHQLAGGLRRA